MFWRWACACCLFTLLTLAFGCGGDADQPERVKPDPTKRVPKGTPPPDGGMGTKG